MLIVLTAGVGVLLSTPINPSVVADNVSRMLAVERGAK